MNEAVVVVGHGSRSDIAQREFLAIVDALQRRRRDVPVRAAHMELAEPGLETVVGGMVAQGARRVVVLPCFLMHGMHLRSDIPALVEALRAAHAGVEFVLGRHIGAHPALAEVLAERLTESLPEPESAPAGIEAESFRRLALLCGEHGWSPEEAALAHRIVHTTGDPLVASALRFVPGAVEQAVRALRTGCAIVCDVEMVRTGLRKDLAARLGCRVEVAVSQPGAADLAGREGITRSCAGMRILSPRLGGAVVAIGNAPTALRELLRQAEEDGRVPAFVAGLPVGFVDAAESKQALGQSSMPHVRLEGTRGGSPLAAASLNALLLLAAGAGFDGDARTEGAAWETSGERT